MNIVFDTEDIVRIPIESLNPDTLNRIIEEYVTREGTDYGDAEYTLAEKVAYVKQQLEKGKVIIVYNSNSESCDIVAKKK
jgi:uncharacterized protein